MIKHKPIHSLADRTGHLVAGLLLLLLCLLAASCSQDIIADVPVDPVTPATPVEPLTRVSLQGSNLEQGDTFTLLVYRKKAKDDTSGSFLYAVSTCTAGAGASVSVSTDYPLSGLSGQAGLELPRGYYRLCAFLPASGSAGIALDSSPSVRSIAFQRGADLLVSVKDLDYDDFTPSGTVLDYTGSEFVHQSSLVCFRVVHLDGGVEDPISLAGITLSGLAGAGTCLYTLKGDMPRTVVSPVENTSQPMRIAPSDGNEFTGNNTPEVTTYPFLVVPGTFTGIGVKADLQTASIGSGAASLTGMIERFVFEPGRFYVFTLHVSKSEVVCTVAKWEPGGSAGAITVNDHGDFLFTVNDWTAIGSNTGNTPDGLDRLPFAVKDWLSSGSNSGVIGNEYHDFRYAVYSWTSTSSHTGDAPQGLDRLPFVVKDWLSAPGGSTVIGNEYHDFRFAVYAWTSTSSHTGNTPEGLDRPLFSVKGWGAAAAGAATAANDQSEPVFLVSPWRPGASYRADVSDGLDRPGLSVNPWTGGSANSATTPKNADETN